MNNHKEYDFSDYAWSDDDTRVNTITDFIIDYQSNNKTSNELMIKDYKALKAWLDDNIKALEEYEKNMA